MVTHRAERKAIPAIDCGIGRRARVVKPRNSQPASSAVKTIITWTGYGWTAWSLAGGLYFIFSARTISQSSHWKVFSNSIADGCMTVGGALLLCGIISLFGMCSPRLNRIAAICCAVWCFIVAVVLQLTTLDFDQGDIDAWMLLICSFSCVMRWALLVLEPHVVDK